MGGEGWEGKGGEGGEGKGKEGGKEKGGEGGGRMREMPPNADSWIRP